MAQNVVVQTTNNPSQSSKEDCAFRINGICSTEDIGGVDARWYRYVSDISGYKDMEGYISSFSNSYFLLENYHDFTVNVLLLVSNDDDCPDETFNVVIKPGAKKLVHTPSCGDTYFYVLKGIITRKL